jgi:adhesin transport system outer membrane protein
MLASKNKVIKVLKKIYFENRSYDIPEQMKDVIKEIADEIKQYKKINVFIQGHAANEGSEKFNKAIAEERAKMVLRALVENYQINPNILTAMGYSNFVPFTTEETEEAMQQNRRVEIILFGEE